MQLCLLRTLFYCCCFKPRNIDIRQLAEWNRPDTEPWTDSPPVVIDDDTLSSLTDSMELEPPPVIIPSLRYREDAMPPRLSTHTVTTSKPPTPILFVCKHGPETIEYIFL
jgi:hypothetical protein